MKLIGEFYREKVMSLPKKSRKKVELEYTPEKIRLESDLFGWRLYHTRYGRKTEHYLEYRTEEEARYLKVFFELGVKELYIPKDNEYLKSILPELEYLKKRTDEILNENLETIFSRKNREILKHMVYRDVMYSGAEDASA